MKTAAEKIWLAGALAGLLCLPITDTVFAANSVTINLEDGIQMAMENNHSIKESECDMDNARWSLHEARRGGGPTLSWSAAAKQKKALLLRVKREDQYMFVAVAPS